MAKPRQISLLCTELRNIKSKITGKRYEISVALPYVYVDDSLKTLGVYRPVTAWPAVYLLDGDSTFGMVRDIVRSMPWCGGTTDAIVVGIAYAEGKSLLETERLRNAERMDDFTPTRDEKVERDNRAWLKRDVKTGGGGKFLEFLKQELIPLIDKRYRTARSKRILVGHSAGGLFTVFAMLQEPRLFRSYIAGSPSLWIAEKSMFEVESAFAKRHKTLPAQLYLGVGESEEDLASTMVSDVYRFAAQLESRKYKGFSITKQVFRDSNHCDVVAPAFQAGLKMALKT